MFVNEERIWILLARKKCGEASSRELEELNILLKENETVLSSEDILDRLWKKSIKIKTGNQSHESWGSIEAAIQKKRNKRQQFKWGCCAAAIMVLLGLTFYFNQRPQKYTATEKVLSAVNNIATPEGARTKIELPDGSVVWVNEGSRLTYNSTTFGISGRDVFLEGEAYFDIHKNAKLPFVVHADQVDIRVLGTTFNVKAYKDDKTIEAALISGKIAVYMKNNREKKIILKPDEKIVISKALPEIKRVINNNRSFKILKIEKDKAGLAKATAWIRHKQMDFDNEPFEQIIEEMEKRYRVKILFANDSLKQLHFSGIIEDETLMEALRALQLSQHFNFYQKDSIVWIGKHK